MPPIAAAVSMSPEAASASLATLVPTATAVEPTEFVPPSAVCPSPSEPVGVPNVLVSIGGGPAIVATPGSSLLTTCTTTASSDSAPKDPTAGLVAQPGDRMILMLPSGWRFLRWEGSDHPAVGEGTNVWPGADTPERPMQIEVPAPIRPGGSIAGYHLDIVRGDDRVVGWLDILVRVDVR
jgi:hypothetical protein